MHEPRVLLLSDIVDSTRIFSALGEAGAARLWAQHDQRARDLLLGCAGREIERGDGFLLLFDQMADAARFAAAYHVLLAALDTPLTARIGIHRGPLRIRDNAPAHVERGARPLDLDGQAKAITARIVSLTLPRQTLASAPAVAEFPDGQGMRRSHGHWRLKGVPEPLELYEIGPDESAFVLPPDAEKVWRVVRAGELWLPAREVPHSLPAERDRFVGRVLHLNALADALERSRLVSLLGTGGTGKTRLAQRLGWSHLGDHPGGVWFCDLSAAVTPDGIVHAAAQGLQLPLGAADPVQQVGDAIAGRGDCLIILDNFEQVARHAEATLGRWLAQAPLARFVVTTREVLGIVGEQALALPPLPADEGQALLRERAAQAGSAPFSDADEAALPELVKLLDGLPLAIELAASRMRIMGPAALLPRMNERFRLLASRGGRPDRQATLRATLDWSWDLLTAPERSALAQLSVFEGGFTLEAAQAVVNLGEVAGDAGGGEAPSAPWVVDVVQALVDKSLVRRVGERRFDLLRSIQEYARMALVNQADDDDLLTKRRHARYFASLSERNAIAARCADAENLVAACRNATASRSTREAVGSLGNAWAALRLSGPFGVALNLADAVTEMTGLDRNERARAEVVAASALDAMGRSREAHTRLNETLKTLPADSLALPRVLCVIGEIASNLGQFETAERELLQANSIAKAQADVETQCRAHNALGWLAYWQSRSVEARAHYLQGLELARQLADLRWEGGLLGNLGALSHTLGQYDEARSYYEQSLALASNIGDQRWEANARCNLGLLLCELERGADARGYLESALVMARRMGHRKLEGTTLCNLGHLSESMAEPERACGNYERAVEIAHTSSDPRSEGMYRAHLGLLLARVGRASDARSCLAIGAQLLQEVNDLVDLALLYCKQAQAELLLGDAEASLGALRRAEALAIQIPTASSSELEKALATARAVLLQV